MVLWTVLQPVPAPWGGAMLVGSLPVKGKRLALDVMMCKAATHTKCIHSITDLVKMAVLIDTFSGLSNIHF